VLAQHLHDLANNPPNPTGPAASVPIAADGSVAAFVPARRALSWHTTAPDGVPVVRERYWVTFQPGEIRACPSCHGVNTHDQAGRGVPLNKPTALRELLRYWKSQNPISSMRIRSSLPNSSTFRLDITGKAGVANVIEATTNFVNWFPIATNTLDNSGAFIFDVPLAAPQPLRFYRLQAP
jgi:hypothetical protein